ncbi:MAG TPA: hypothetical protein VJ731_02765 [Terriglobales bacterium]|nr:hypothetical protein [Terriglobales bacterium]
MQLTPGRLSIVVLLALRMTALGAQDDARIPPEVRFKSGYTNSVPKPPDFASAMLWGIAIADSRVPGYENALVEVAHTQLSCRVDGRDVVLNDDYGSVRGGLFRRYPWFGTDAHETMPLAFSDDHRTVILKVGTHPDRVWHFWAASPRAEIPAGKLKGCTIKILARISPGALLQVGFDYWRNSTIGYGSGGNNHETGASKWYLPSDAWQEAVFSDIKH